MHRFFLTLLLFPLLCLGAKAKESPPYVALVVESDPTSDDVQSYFKVTIRSGGADTPRSVQLRQKSDGTWLLWEQYLMADIKLPKSMDPWM
jgi:hypothetical protein